MVIFTYACNLHLDRKKSKAEQNKPKPPPPPQKKKPRNKNTPQKQSIPSIQQYLQNLSCIQIILMTLGCLGLGGSTNVEQLQVDQVVDTISDFLTEMYKPVFEQDATRKVCYWTVQTG